MNSYERLCTAIDDDNWTEFMDTLKPKDFFPRDEKGNLPDRKLLAKIAETLTNPKKNVPDDVRIVLLKCLVNSCVDGYTHEDRPRDDVELLQDHRYKLYKSSSTSESPKSTVETFPYDGVIEWTVNYVLNNTVDSKISEDRVEILRLSVRFLCNLTTFALRNKILPHPLTSDDFKIAITTLAGAENTSVSRAACAFIHNTLKSLPESYYDETRMKKMVRILIESDKNGIRSAGESLILLSQRPNWLRRIYPDLDAESKLHLLKIVHEDLRESVYSELRKERSTNFPIDVAEFLSDRFKKRSDLILKTVDSYMSDMEPTEVTSLLDSICLITSDDSMECQVLKNDKSLVINCIFLLKSLHMAGRASSNNFTPVQRLSEIAPCNVENEETSGGRDIQDHPAFGFKASLIRAIGNLSHKHRENQKLVRETDAIPLLLDCCNIDARNPLIMQWAIFALRNLCEDCPENQKIIRNCNRVGTVDDKIIDEMGIILNRENDDGKAIGIVPLPRNK